jgi:triosephosphate isomerase
MRKKYIFGNWKMHGLRQEARALAEACARLALPEACPDNCISALFPPFTALDLVRAALEGSALALGAQTCSFERQGAFTGEVSASMLKDAGCRYVLAGHSERRTLHQETDAKVRAQAEAALRAGLIPVICVGECEEDRAQGLHLRVIEAQVRASVPREGECLIAYEPIWAIGSGRTPDRAAIEEAHKTIASCVASATPDASLPVLYGGSVKPENAQDILNMRGVDGLLVGGASLSAESFGAILRAVASDVPVVSSPGKQALGKMEPWENGA